MDSFTLPRVSLVQKCLKCAIWIIKCLLTMNQQIRYSHYTWKTRKGGILEVLHLAQNVNHAVTIKYTILFLEVSHRLTMGVISSYFSIMQNVAVYHSVSNF